MQEIILHHTAFIYLVGTSCLGTALLIGNESLGWLQTTLALIGKAFATVAFGNAYIFTGELYPTGIRSTAIGSCSMISRVGSVVALLMKGLRVYWPALPLFITGICCLFAALVVILILPETAGYPMPETIEDALQIGGKKPRQQEETDLEMS